MDFKVVVAQFIERSLPKPEIHSSNPVTVKTPTADKARGAQYKMMKREEVGNGHT